jgi:hypothetical protein
MLDDFPFAVDFTPSLQDEAVLRAKDEGQVDVAAQFDQALDPAVNFFVRQWGR